MRRLIKKWLGLVEPDESVLKLGTKVRVEVAGEEAEQWFRVSQISATRSIYDTTVHIQLCEQD